MTSSAPTGRWFKSSRSSNGTGCVEVKFEQQAVGVRDSKDPAGPALVTPPARWLAFVADLKAGAFDRV